MFRQPRVAVEATTDIPFIGIRECNRSMNPSIAESGSMGITPRR
jgi:hypothetical protein